MLVGPNFHHEETLRRVDAEQEYQPSQEYQILETPLAETDPQLASLTAGPHR